MPEGSVFTWALEPKHQMYSDSRRFEEQLRSAKIKGQGGLKMLPSMCKTLEQTDTERQKHRDGRGGGREGERFGEYTWVG